VSKLAGSCRQQAATSTKQVWFWHISFFGLRQWCTKVDNNRHALGEINPARACSLQDPGGHRGEYRGEDCRLMVMATLLLLLAEVLDCYFK